MKSHPAASPHTPPDPLLDVRPQAGRTPTTVARGLGSYRWPLRGAVVATAAATVFLVAPALAGIPARLIDGCALWIASATVLELLSALGFVLCFKLVFAVHVGRQRSSRAALRALAASTILPGGGMVGPATGAWSTSTEKPVVSRLARSTIAFVLLTNAAAVTVLAGLGLLLGLGLPGGPHGAPLTVLPSLLATGLMISTLVAGRSPGRSDACRRRELPRWLAEPGRALSDGVSEALTLLRGGDWKLIGALGYYLFDNAALWAAFHAYGHAPAIEVVMMGYLVGSLAGALPLPAGLGAVEGGLIGALVLYGAPVAPAAAAVLLYRGISLSVPIALGAISYAPGTGDRRLLSGSRWTWFLATRAGTPRPAARRAGLSAG